MMETMDQVSLKMEFSWTFNKSFQNSKKLFLSLIDLDMLTCRVLEILLNNLTWSKNESWSRHSGEEHVKVWHQFDLVLTFNCGCLLVAVKSLTLPSWVLIIC
jgi:hypothetical protein